MDNMTMILIGVTTTLVIGGAIALYYYRKRSLTKLFDQVYESSKQVPKQKKTRFLLLMFIETMSASKKKPKKKSKENSKSTASVNKLNNPKYLELQLLKMSKILKSGPKGQDKKTKQSLRLLKDYLAWEKKQKAINIK
ncbi:MAG: hypothetical protein JJE29_05825 [Peptostreptococcaceae bacterium]|nr:hypothetical protein [Peptostreptococcaceae bacterium]